MQNEFKPIEEQENVLKVLGKSTIVSASAGSGKTSVLIRKISKYIQENNVDISNILTLTYTNAAAGEMKQRLSDSLFSYIQKLEINDKKIEIFLQQIEKMSTADVSTFHSFYERIIKKYFYILKIDPSFKILSNEDILLLKQSSFEKAIDNLKNSDFESYLKITDILGKKRKDNAIRDRLFKLDEFLSSQLDKGKWLDETSKGMFYDKEQTYKILSDDILENINYFLSEFQKLLKQAVESGENKLSSHINDCCLKIEALKNLKFEKLYEEINNFGFSTLRMSKDISNLELFEKIKETKNGFKNIIKPYKRTENDYGDFETIENSFDSCLKNVQSIIDLYKEYSQVLSINKMEKNSFEFSDLEQFCLELLNDEKVRAEIKNQYKLIFVDEFQDTNPIQYEIIKKISSGDNVFIVGDPKQSIYGFRQTDVEIFNKVFKEHSESEISKALYLRSNFRSNKNILKFVDGVFNVLMREKLSGVNYREDSQFKAMSENSCENNAVIISMIDVEKEEKIKDKKQQVYDIYEDIPKEKKTNLEAKLITHQIGKILKEKIFDDKLKVERKVNYGDISILLKNRSNLLNNIIKLFQHYNIPFLVDDKVDLLSSKEVCLLLSILKLCNNSKDDVNVSIVLASNFVDMSYDDLAKIRIDFRDENFFYDCCLRYLEKNDEISKKLDKFYKLIKDLKFDIEFKGISYAISNLLFKTNFYKNLMLKNDDDLRIQLIKQFISYVEQSSFNRDLASFIRFIDNTKDIFVSSIKKCDTQAVNITTIHGSKGLEYPVVFLCDTGRDLNKTKPETSDLKINKNLGMAIKNYDETERKIYDSIFERVIKIEEKKKNLAENLRLLYVALTRAKNKLFISGEVSKDIKPIADEFTLLNSRDTYINYMLGTFSEGGIAKFNQNIDYEKDGVLVHSVKDEDFKLEVFTENAQNLEKRINKLKEYKEYSCPSSSSTNLAQKTSVTKIISEAHNQESLTTEPIKFDINENLRGETTADKGTLIHAILEKVDFNLSESKIEDNIKQLIEKQNNQFDKDYLFEMIRTSVVNIKKLIPHNSKIYKEKQFLLKASLKDIFNNENEEKILIQGKIDLICLGEKNIIIDYKFTSIKNKEVLIKKYEKQLLLYKFALEKALSIKVDEIYIFDLVNSQPISLK